MESRSNHLREPLSPKAFSVSLGACSLVPRISGVIAWRIRRRIEQRTDHSLKPGLRPEREAGIAEAGPMANNCERRIWGLQHSPCPRSPLQNFAICLYLLILDDIKTSSCLPSNIQNCQRAAGERRSVTTLPEPAPSGSRRLIGKTEPRRIAALRDVLAFGTPTMDLRCVVRRLLRGRVVDRCVSKKAPRRAYFRWIGRSGHRMKNGALQKPSSRPESARGIAVE